MRNHGCLILVVLVVLILVVLSGVWVAGENPRCLLAADPWLCVELTRGR